MASKALPSPEVLRQLLRYEPETGKLFWLERSVSWFSNSSGRAAREQKRWNGRWAGAEALAAKTLKGYRHGAILGQTLRSHCVIWAMMTGEWPTAEVDHANGERSDNRWWNLRMASHSENAHNKKIARNNTSGVKGVCFDTRRGKWLAQISTNRKRRHVGYFATIKDAERAIRSAREASHGDFHRHS